jgi:hypothetical protein
MRHFRRQISRRRCRASAHSAARALLTPDPLYAASGERVFSAAGTGLLASESHFAGGWHAGLGTNARIDRPLAAEVGVRPSSPVVKRDRLRPGHYLSSAAVRAGLSERRGSSKSPLVRSRVRSGTTVPSVRRRAGRNRCLLALDLRQQASIDPRSNAAIKCGRIECLVTWRVVVEPGAQLLACTD